MRARVLRRRDGTTGSSRGQGVVEFAIILPAILVLLLGVLEFGFAFDHHMTLEYATREGARTGAALANGGNPPGCAAGESPARDLVDPLIVAAVERVLTSPGSPVAVDQVSRITIYRADQDGNATGDANTWDYSPGGGPSIGGTRLDFAPATAGLGDTSGWRSCARDNTWDRRTLPWSPPDSLGVSITYTYRPVTALSAVVGFFGGSRGPAVIEMRDRSVMALNPDDR